MDIFDTSSACETEQGQDLVPQPSQEAQAINS